MCAASALRAAVLSKPSLFWSRPLGVPGPVKFNLALGRPKNSNLMESHMFPDLRYFRENAVASKDLRADDLIRNPMTPHTASIHTRRCKAIASCGPSLSTDAQIAASVESGVDAFRINMAKADKAENMRLYKSIRAAARRLGRRVAIIASLQGPKFRIGDFEGRDNCVLLKNGQTITLTQDAAVKGDATQVYCGSQEVYSVAEIGDSFHFRHGPLACKVVDINPSKTTLTMQMVSVGTVKLCGGSSIRIPSKMTRISPLTSLDYEHLHLLSEEMHVDWVLFSHVNSQADIASVRNYLSFLAKKNPAFRPMVMAKIETPLAALELASIAPNVDGVCIARGALSAEIDYEYLPTLQKSIIKIARDFGKVVFMATDVLGSIKDMYLPTRAEVSDVTNSCIDGVDGLVLCSETSIGVDAVNAVKYLIEVIIASETDPLEDSYKRTLLYTGLGDRQPLYTDDCFRYADSIAVAAISLASITDAKCIVCFTKTGASLLRLARQRPVHPIIALAASEEASSWLSTVWGTSAHVCPKYETIAEACKIVDTEIPRSGVAARGDNVVIIFGNYGSCEAVQEKQHRGCNHIMNYTLR